jgi:hypothetical protein
VPLDVVIAFYSTLGPIEITLLIVNTLIGALVLGVLGVVIERKRKR